MSELFEYKCNNCGHEGLNTLAVPDVPELVRYRLNSLGELVYSENGEYVLYSQAAAVIAAKDAEIEALAQDSDGRSSIAYSAGYYQAECNLPEHEREVDALAEYRAMKAKLAQIKAQVPVAYLWQHPDHENDYASADSGANLTNEDKKYGWMETPLYAAPVDQTAEIERLKKEVSRLALENLSLVDAYEIMDKDSK